MSTRERILEAAWSITVEQGWNGVTMARIADAAGVSRQSVYNEFGNKEHLAEALIGQELLRFLDVVDDGISRGDTPAQSTWLAARSVLDLAEDNPLLRATLSAAAGSPSPLLPLLTSASQPLIDTATARVAAALSARYPQVDLGASVVDAVVRLTLSHVVQPGRPEDLHAAVVGLLDRA